jgi:hypothetical protein
MHPTPGGQSSGAPSRIDVPVPAPERAREVGAGRGHWTVPDRRRALQLALATIWLLDGLLQLQPVMFTAGHRGLSGMIDQMATGNPSVVARSIRWNASLVDHHAVLADAAFALAQILIGLGIAWRPSLKPALAASFGWSLAVWWFGEGLGGVLHGVATPVGGGPGPVLFYALLAVLLWPADRAGPRYPFVAARAVGTVAAKVIWVTVWIVLGLLALAGSGRSPDGIGDLIGGYAGQPGWVAGLDHDMVSLTAGHGAAVAALLALICAVVASGVLLPFAAARATVLVAVATAVVVWVVGENLGGLMAGGATDPSSGPLLVLLALAYWPRRSTEPTRAVTPASPVGGR